MSDDESAEASQEICPEDAFWEFEPAASGEQTVSTDVDQVLYLDR